MTFNNSEVLFGVASILLLLYYYLTKNFNHWKSQQIAGPRPIPFFGNFKDVALGKIHLADHVKNIYDAYPKDSVIGLFARSSPVLLAKDPEIIKEVLIKNFNVFPNRGVKIHDDIDPLAQHLVFLNYERWKPLRKTLTPVFTSGKLKEMFYLISECTEHFKQYMEKLAMKGEPVECRELTAKFTTDVIGVCAFGLNMNAMSEDENEFRIIGRKIFANNWWNKARHLARTLPHWMAVLLKPIARDEKMINFFVDTIKDTMDYRRKNNVQRNDFIDLLMNIKDHPEKFEGAEMSDMLLTAQAFVFFVAGFETSSTTMSHALYELALNPDMQNKLREEVTATLKENNDKLDYESVKNMKYLDKVFKETLRKYPPAFSLARVAVKDHKFSNSNISVNKGTRILIPVYAIHHDSNIYPEPEKFDPERFDDDIVKMRPQMSYLPFGDGPRNCIGERFARNQTKLGLAVAVKNFKFEVCEKTCLTYEKQKNSTLLAPKGGLHLAIRKCEF